MKITSVEALKIISNEVRKNIIEEVYEAQSGHPGGSLSCADILTVLYFNQMNVNPKMPDAKERDRLVLSKGHCSPALYAILAQKGYFDKKELKKFKAISVREEAGKKIAKELTKREDIEVLVDPTMLLKKDEWEKLEKKPKKLETGKKYILNYFLGEISKEKKDAIENFAKENGYEIINILDTKSPFYKTGPSEFLYLVHNAEIVFTDSFHACVFSILYNKPFYVIERVAKGMKNMNSRIDTLLNKMGLQNRKFESVIETNCEDIYEEVNKKLNIEREKALSFMKNALD